MDEQMKKRKESLKRKRLKKKLASMTAMVLVLMLGILGTMAYLSTVSKPKVNTFTGSKGIELTLKEPEWNPNDPGTPSPGDGQYDAENYTPGKVIAKDPTLTNTTKDSGDSAAQEWVAIAITYQVGEDDTDVSYETLRNLIKDISFNTTESVSDEGDNWVLLEPTSSDALDTTKGFAIFMYNKPLGQNESTRPLFEQIEIKDTAELETGLKSLNTIFNTTAFTVNGGLPGFKINVIGGAIKNECYKKDDASTLATCINDLKDEDKTTIQENLVAVLQKELNIDASLGYVTKP